MSTSGSEEDIGGGESMSTSSGGGVDSDGEDGSEGDDIEGSTLTFKFKLVSTSGCCCRSNNRLKVFQQLEDS